MDELSPEVLSIILSHLLAKSTKEHPSAYATVARSWQYVAETFSFADITIKSKELNNFARIFSGPGRHRRRLLRHLNYNIGLPTHGDSREDHATNEHAFGFAVQSLFDLLESWDKGDGDNGNQGRHDGSIAWRSRPKMELHIWLSHDIDIKNADGPVDHAFDVCNSSAARRYQILLPEFKVPQVQCITSFTVGATLGRAPHPTTLCQLASLLPSLESLDLTYWDPAVKRHDVRKEHRVALGDGLGEIYRKLPRLERLCIRRQDGVDPSNHSFACGDLQRDGVDPLCDGIRHLMVNCHLKELQLENIIISPDLFRLWPSSERLSSADQEAPTVIHLKRLDIKSGILAPSGKWYYTGDPASVKASEGDFILEDDEDDNEDDNEDDDDDDDDAEDKDSDDSDDEDNSTRDRFVNGERPHYEWRTHPDPERFDPLIHDFTDVILKRMPSLEWARLEIGCGLDEFAGIIIQCCEAGQPFVHPPGKRRKRPWVEDVTVRRCKAWVGKASKWDIPSDVMATWREWAGISGSVEKGVWP